MESTPERPFSVAWTFASIVLFLAVELMIGTWVGPLVAGRYVSPMFRIEVEMLMHLGSFYLGGVLVGLLSPGIRLAEPAVGAFASVAIVFLISFFMPTWYYRFDLFRMSVGGVIALLLALAGAYLGERLMGNVTADGEDVDTARGRLRGRLWNESDGLFAPQRRTGARLP